MLSAVGIGGTECASVGADGLICGWDARGSGDGRFCSPGSVPVGSVFARAGFGGEVSV